MKNPAAPTAANLGGGVSSRPTRGAALPPSPRLLIQSSEITAMLHSERNRASAIALSAHLETMSLPLSCPNDAALKDIAEAVKDMKAKSMAFSQVLAKSACL
jgi:hypothetical protein